MHTTQELEVHVWLQGHDRIDVTETWWDSLHDWKAIMDVYVLLRKDRPERQGGGGALYVTEQVKCIKLCLGVDEEWIENLWVKIKGRVGVYYRPPDQEKEVFYSCT